MVTLSNGNVTRRAGAVGPAGDPRETTRAVEFNDVEALERELAHGDVACVLAEPALTNIGIVLPDPGFHDQLRSLTRAAGSLLVLDETHTLCAGPGGMTRRDALAPDMLVVGKAIGGGVPVAAFGMTEQVAERAAQPVREPGLNVSGIGGTLSANALAVRAVRATLESTLRAEDYARAIPLAAQWTSEVEAEIAALGLDWTVTQLGIRAEYSLGSSSGADGDPSHPHHHELESLLHLYALNRGVLITPFHNMALICRDTSANDVRRHTEVFRACLDEVRRAR